MLNFLLIIGALATIGAAFAKFLDEVGLRDRQKTLLQEKFDSWWRSVAETDHRALALALARKLSYWLDTYFGERLFSKCALRKSFLLGSCILALLLGLTGLINGRSLGVAPWDTYRETFTDLEETWRKQESRPETETTKQQRDALRSLRSAVVPYNSTVWMIAYSVSSLLALLLLDSVLFFLSVVYSRMILREIIAAGRLFSTITLLIANFALVVPAWALVFLIVTIIFTPLLWLLLPLVFLLTTVSVYWLLAIVAGGTIAGWFFGSAPLKIITLTGFLPCVLAVLITFLTSVVLYNRRRFHFVVTFLLRLCAEKGPTKVAAATFGLMAAVLAAMILLIRYWK